MKRYRKVDDEILEWIYSIGTEYFQQKIQHIKEVQSFIVKEIKKIDQEIDSLGAFSKKKKRNLKEYKIYLQAIASDNKRYVVNPATVIKQKMIDFEGERGIPEHLYYQFINMESNITLNVHGSRTVDIIKGIKKVRDELQLS